MSRFSRWSAGELANFVDGSLSPALAPDTQIRDFFARVWACGKGSLFVPLEFEGPRQIRMTRNAVTKRGAIGGMVDEAKGLDNELPYILVPDLQQAALKLAHHTREAYSGKMVGVTGSAGKTTTTAMIATCLRKHGTAWKTRNNNNATPQVTTNVISIPEENEYAVIELALSGGHRVSDAASIARPHVAIITSISKAHIESFAEEDDPAQAVVNEKLSIMDHVVPGGSVVLPSASEHFDQMLAYAEKSERIDKIITCGARKEDDVRVIASESFDTGERVTLASDDEMVIVDIPFVGAHMQSNTLLVAGAMRALNLPAASATAVSDTAQTMSSLIIYDADFSGKRVRVFNDSYNSTDQNVKAHCELAGARPGRKFLIVSDVPKLAHYAEEIHAELLPHIDAAGFEHVITVGPYFMKAAAGLKTPSSSFDDRFQAIARVLELIQDGDTIFVKGSPESEFKDIMMRIGDAAEIKRVTG
ncbi:Mur ligase family protein [Ruegeria arenilitoris]|uniref:Mur ligase family protein n=1 Tax=Ruegeria arenilitoris TaxID=1173585 RepID=UPI00147F326D|nr:Mur ligase family protein [Ruegeria arenilitoris]